MNNPEPRAHLLRKGRVSEPGRIYLITTVTHQRQAFFSDWQCGRLLVQALVRESFRAETLAYVVMPDHLHWLMSLNDEVSLSLVMRSIKSVSSRQVNALLHRRGKLWQSGFHDHALREEEDLVATARYVVANPLRAGLVKRVGNYPLWDAIWL
jgi:REP element-mobilizing transposase RayT